MGYKFYIFHDTFDGQQLHCWSQMRNISILVKISNFCVIYVYAPLLSDTGSRYTIYVFTYPNKVNPCWWKGP